MVGGQAATKPTQDTAEALLSVLEIMWRIQILSLQARTGEYACRHIHNPAGPRSIRPREPHSATHRTPAGQGNR